MLNDQKFTVNEVVNQIKKECDHNLSKVYGITMSKEDDYFITVDFKDDVKTYYIDQIDYLKMINVLLNNFN